MGIPPVQYFVGKTAAVTGIVQGLAWTVMSLICIIEYYKGYREHPDVKYASYSRLLSESIWATYLDSGFDSSNKIRPYNFNTFMWIYFPFSFCWFIISVKLFSAIHQDRDPSIVMKLWGANTIFISFLDLILAFLLLLDYENCNRLDITCHTIIGIVMTVAARGVTLWAFNVLLSCYLITFGRQISRNATVNMVVHHNISQISVPVENISNPNYFPNYLNPPVNNGPRNQLPINHWNGTSLQNGPRNQLPINHWNGTSLQNGPRNQLPINHWNGTSLQNGRRNQLPMNHWNGSSSQEYLPSTSEMETNNGNLDSTQKEQHTSTTIDAIFSKKVEASILPIVSSPDAEIYKKCTRRGTAIIFNHKKFTISCATREGTEKDRDDLENVLNELKFDVKAYDDLNYDQILDVLNVISKMNHTDSECLVIAVMSHGENGILYARDRQYETKKIWTCFSPLNCPSLAGKPKLFFIQACRGDKTDPGAKVSYVETDSKKFEHHVYTIPVMADILIMYATVEGYYAWRDPVNGSYFIQALVKQLRKHHESRDLLSILTNVNREVAVGFTSNTPGNSHFNEKKEMCSIVSMLTRLYYFNIK